MAYPPRLFVEGYWYHVYTKGQRGEPLYFSPLDRIAYLSFLDRELGRRGGVIGSYCLMTNRVHLLLRMGKTDLGNIFKAVHMKYAKYFNQKRSTSGHVFQGRPGIKIVLDNSYLLQVVGYIHLKPVEAKMVDRIEQFEWSSWPWFLQGSNNELARSCYPPGFDTQNKSSIFSEVIRNKTQLPNGENYWGTGEEWARMERRKEGREGRKYRERRERRLMEEIASESISGTEFTVEDLKSPKRGRELSKKRHEAMSRMYEEGYSSTEIGKYFNRTPASVNYARNTIT